MVLLIGAKKANSPFNSNNVFTHKHPCMPHHSTLPHKTLHYNTHTMACNASPGRWPWAPVRTAGRALLPCGRPSRPRVSWPEKSSPTGPRGASSCGGSPPRSCPPSFFFAAVAGMAEDGGWKGEGRGQRERNRETRQAEKEKGKEMQAGGEGVRTGWVDKTFWLLESRSNQPTPCPTLPPRVKSTPFGKETTTTTCTSTRLAAD